MEIIFVTDGKGTVAIEDKVFEVKRGDLLIYNADVMHFEKSNETDPMEILFVAYDKLEITDLPPNWLLPPSYGYVFPTGDMYDIFYRYFSTLVNEFDKKERFYMEIAQNISRTLLMYIFRLINKTENAGELLASGKTMEIALKFIDENFRNEITLDTIAEACFTNKYYLSHLFTRAQGVSVGKYILDKRIKEAKRQLENKDLTKCGPCKIKSCIVNTDRTQIYENELVANIQNAIAKHPDIKIWNLSQGTTKTIDNDRYSDLGIALDSLQKDNRILICKSAGNVDPRAENQRITDGADSLLSLVVGSIAHKKTTNNDAKENDRSPFSRIGPGVENAVKPDLVHYGGNMDTHLSLFSEWGRQFCRWSGTSFSTPRITALAANLNQMIGGECNPLLLKALLVHNSDYPVGLSKTPEELRREMGFGLPSVITDMLNNDADECTMVFHQTLQKGTNIVSLDFPYPQSLVENGYFIGEITLSMAVNPVINAGQGCEYCQSQVDVLLETYDHVEHVQLGEGMMRNESRTSKDAVNVLNASIYSSKAFKKEFAEERMLIEQGDKYQPIKKYYVDLSKMTDTNRRKALGENRKWALKLTGLYRDAAVQALERDGEVLSQDVVVVVTIKDPRHRGTIYTECLDLLEQRGYVHNDINIHNDIRVDN